MNPNRLAELIDFEETRLRNRPDLKSSDPTFIPIFLTGGIGDGIMSKPVIQRLLKEGYQLLVYSNHADALNYFYADTIRIHKGEVPNFTWSLHLDSVIKFKFSRSFGGFALPAHKNIFDQQQDFFKENYRLAELIQEHPKQKYILTRMAHYLGYNISTFALYTLGFKDVFHTTYERKHAPFHQITIHDGFDVNNAHCVSDRATKQWPISYWGELVRLLKLQFPDYEIIQLGTGETARVIPGTNRCLINQTTIHQAFDIISESAFHIDTDSGLAHAATALGIPAVVLFGPTPLEFYGHPQNLNILSKKSCAGNCFFLEDSWMDKCPIGYPSAKCMEDISPEMVIEQIKKAPGFLVPGPDSLNQ